MPARRPLTIVSGQIQVLQSGDYLDVPQAGGDVISNTNDEASPVVIGTPVYNDVADGVKKAKADASTTARVIGLVRDTTITNGVAGSIQVNGVLAFANVGQADAVMGTSGGLVVGTLYFLSAATAGVGTSTAPSTTGQLVVPLGRAISTTELLLSAPFNPIAL